jgi:hypothetical protein
MGVLCYFDGFLDDMGTVGLDVGCDLCSLKVDAVFFLCGVFSCHWSLVLQSDASDVFGNSGGYVAAHLASVQLST